MEALDQEKQQHEKSNKMMIIGLLIKCVYVLKKEKYQCLIKKHENHGVKNVKDPKAFIEYLNSMQDC